MPVKRDEPRERLAFRLLQADTIMEKTSPENAMTEPQLPGETPSDRRLRVFVSYSHKNQDLFEELRKVLEGEPWRFVILSDHDIEGGTPFTDAIKGRISHAHLFLPLITAEAQKGPWVNQETGYAMARDIPIYPIVVDDSLPTEMTAQLQCIMVTRERFAVDLRAGLNKHPPGRLVEYDPVGPIDMVRVAEWPEQRAEWLGDYCQRIRDLGHTGMVRQIGVYSSFCIPDLPADHELWDARDELHERGHYLRHFLRRERRQMEHHARRSGCRLIIYPGKNLHDQSHKAHATRLGIVRDFITGFLQDKLPVPLEIVVSPRPPAGNLIVVGDWFLAKSAAPRPQGYYQTVLNWHSPTVRQRVEQFDREFEELCIEKGIKPEESTRNALDEISGLIGVIGNSEGTPQAC